MTVLVVVLLLELLLEPPPPPPPPPPEEPEELEPLLVEGQAVQEPPQSVPVSSPFLLLSEQDVKLTEYEEEVVCFVKESSVA